MAHQGQDLSGPCLQEISNVLVPGSDVGQIDKELGLVVIELIPLIPRRLERLACNNAHGNRKESTHLYWYVKWASPGCAWLMKSLKWRRVWAFEMSVSLARSGSLFSKP